MASVVGIIFVVALFGLVFGILFLKDRTFGRRAQPSARGMAEHADKLGAKLRKYIGRSAPWSRLNETQLFVHDLKSQPPRLLTMEPLHQLLFESADREHTVGELLDRLIMLARKNSDNCSRSLRTPRNRARHASISVRALITLRSPRSGAAGAGAVDRSSRIAIAAGTTTRASPWATRMARSAATILLAACSIARAEPFSFSTGNTDGQMAAASRPAGNAGIEIEAADDFLLESQTTITAAVFIGLIPGAESAADVTSVAVEIYRVFPLDSANPPSGQVPTRANSPADVAFMSRDSLTSSLSFTVANNGGFGAANSVVNGIHPIPTQTTGGEGPMFGNEVTIATTLNPPLVLPAGHYFFVPQVALTSGTFLWLSAPKPIVAPGTPFTGDLQSWIRNSDLAPDWLRIGTDIVGSGSFNQVFSLTGYDDVIFRNGFD